jgi:hypothetical protein
MRLSPVPIGIRMRVCGGDCYCELPRIPLLRRWVNKDVLSSIVCANGGERVHQDMADDDSRRRTHSAPIPMGMGSQNPSIHTSQTCRYSPYVLE